MPPVTRARSCWGTRWCTPHVPPLRSGLSPAAVVCFLAQVKCYHKKYRSATRDVIFRLQFHTGAVQGYGLVFGKEDLDSASKGEASRAPRWWGGGGGAAAAWLCFALCSPCRLPLISRLTKL